MRHRLRVHHTNASLVDLQIPPRVPGSGIGGCGAGLASTRGPRLPPEPRSSGGVSITLPSLIVATSLNVGIVMLVEAGLSFLGLGILPPTPSWGNMLSASQNNFLASVVVAGEHWGLSYADVSTGEFLTTQGDQLDQLSQELMRLQPAEVLVLDDLKPGDHVLIAESCSHHPIAEDIGRVKIPRWLTQYVGGKLEFTHVQGHDFPVDTGNYRLVVHCGACVWSCTKTIPENPDKTNVELRAGSGGLHSVEN